MRALVQRVTKASVTVDGAGVGAIGAGLLVLLGVEVGDGHEDVDRMCGKLTKLRIFPDEQGRMDRNIMQFGGEMLLVSQFTLFADTAKGDRPSYIRAARPEQAVPLYEALHAALERTLGAAVPTGRFGAYMHVELVNDGPVTLMIDSRQRL
ncbi:MAG: D-aminoacyl-tRNA deacylase [Flavobacteriales bacterium]